MRAREFTINIPINIKINGDGDPEVSTGDSSDPQSSDDLQQNPVMVPPLQQGIELAKASMGKDSPVIDKLTQDHPDIGDESEDAESQLQRIKQLTSPNF